MCVKKEAIGILIYDKDDLNLGINQRCVEIISEREQREIMVYAFRELTCEVESLIENNQIQIALLDIEPKQESGLIIANKLQRKNARIPIIFITSYKQYKGEACDIMAIGYIEKPVNLERFELLYSRALALAEYEKRRNSPELIHIVVDKKHIQVKVSSIICAEKVLRKVEVRTSKGVYVSNGTLHELTERLGTGFIKVNQSVAVNRDKILSMDNTTVYLTNGEQHTIGRTYIKQVRSCLRDD